MQLTQSAFNKPACNCPFAARIRLASYLTVLFILGTGGGAGAGAQLGPVVTQPGVPAVPAGGGPEHVLQCMSTRQLVQQGSDLTSSNSGIRLDSSSTVTAPAATGCSPATTCTTPYSRPLQSRSWSHLLLLAPAIAGKPEEG